MRPSERLIAKLNEALKPHGYYIHGKLDWPHGGAKQEDCCRWVGSVAKIGGTGVAVKSIASWNTISRCLRGFELSFDGRRSEAGIMVDAKEIRA